MSHHLQSEQERLSLPECNALPNGWEKQRYKQLGQFFGGGTPSKDNLDYWNGNVPWVSPKDMKQPVIADAEDHITDAAVHASATKMVPSESLLMVVRSGILQHTIPVGINTVPVALNQDMKAFVPREGVSAKYYYYLVEGSQRALLNIWRKTGATVESLEFDYVRNTLLPVPPLTTQRAIANFLDRKTATIDRLIAAKERLIELLAEKRQALITRAVTRGLDPNVPLKDSGIPWLGKIPKHWEVKRLKHLMTMIGGFAFSSQDYTSDGVQLIRIGNLYTDRLQLDRQPMFLPVHFLQKHVRFVVSDGDLLMSLTGTMGKRDYGFAVLLGANSQYLLNQRVARLRCNSQILPAWALRVLQSNMYLDQLYSLPAGTKQANLSNEDVLNICVPVPPTAEQYRLSKDVEAELTSIDEMTEIVIEQIGIFSEYRQTLISAAVTGKIDVRGDGGEEEVAV